MHGGSPRGQPRDRAPWSRSRLLVLPGPPRELQALWPKALETEPVRAVLARAVPPQRRVMRFYGASESAIAEALASAGGERRGVEVTICAREFEIHVDLFGPSEGLADALRSRLAPHLFSDYQLVPLGDGTFEATTPHRKV